MKRRAAGAPLVFGLMMMAMMTQCVGESGDECAAARAWAGAALLREPPAAPATPLGLTVRRQDHGELTLGRSVLNTPLQIGDKHYDHGLGTHSVSEIVVHLPRPGALFTADAGIDNNYDTAGARGSVIFAVELGGNEVYRSDICRGGQAPVPVRLDLGGADEFTLRVFDGGDGPGWDQSDWADAAVTLDDGARVWLDEMPVTTVPAALSADIPFSFTYGGKPSSQLLPNWKLSRTKSPAADGAQRDVVTYADPDTGLEIACETTTFADFPAVEWVLHLRNTGSADTPIIESIRPLDLTLDAPLRSNIILHRAHGSTAGATDFLPVDDPVQPNSDMLLAPAGGRSSNGVLPFFNLEWRGGGLVGAIGWSGQWAMRCARDGGYRLTLQAGQQTTHLTLHPGESIRTPRILLVMWRGDDRLRGHNLLRRLLLAHYVPRHDGEIILPPVTQNTWFVFNAGNEVTEANQLEAIRLMAPLGVEGYWLDAGWFEGGWPNGAGSWVPRTDAFPRGLKPLSDAAHEKGMQFVLWFEPERVNSESRIAKEHPDWVLHVGGGDGLFNLGDPEARAWLTGYLSQCVEDWGIDIYRNDFNIDPLPFWQAADAPDRQGIAEIRYVEGLYAMWDELRRRHPGVAIDNCASGGRRIDLETVSRSFPLTRSDSPGCGYPLAAWDQVQTAGLSLYVPLHASLVWDCEPYPWRSVATTGTSMCMDARAKEFSPDKAKRAIAETKSLRPLWLGDYYPLLPITTDEERWCGWQFDRPDLGRGFVMLFRRAQSPYTGVAAELRGLDPAATYELTFVDSGEVRRVKGADLGHLQVRLDAAPSSALITYRKLGE
jgi:alpha-galactosidase